VKGRTESNCTVLWHCRPKPFMPSVARRAKSKHMEDVVRHPSTSLLFHSGGAGSKKSRARGPARPNEGGRYPASRN